MPEPLVDSTMKSQCDSHYRAIGRVVVEWSHLMSYLREMLQMLAGVDNVAGEVITAQITSVNNLLDALSALAGIRSIEKAGDREFKDIVNRFRSLSVRRNEMVNDVWTFDPGVTNRWPITKGTGSADGPISTPTSEVDALAVEIEQFSETFLTFRRDFLKSAKLWPGQ